MHVKKGAPVHSYYIIADMYLKDLSDKTGGRSAKFNAHSEMASE
jgi:hypothetical protein